MKRNRIVVPSVAVFAHPIDTDLHPEIPPGWRWAIHVGDTDPSDITSCVQAGHCATRQEAMVVGESHGAAVALALRMFLPNVRYMVTTLGHDPIKPKQNMIRFFSG